MESSFDPVHESLVLTLVRNAAREDTAWTSGLIFNSLSGRPHPLATAAYAEFADRNLLKEQSTQGRRMEREVVREYGEWFGARDQEGRNGYVCSGGTEGNFVALWSAKAKRPDRRKVVASQYAHYSYDRFAVPLGLNLVSVPLRHDMEVDVAGFVRSIDNDTLAVIITAGDPVLGRVDPLADILATARNHGCAVHIDAAYGGYFIPFVEEYASQYQSILSGDTGATTLTLDPHKYGLCPLGAGVILFSDKGDLDRISLSVPFPPIESRTFQGSRSAGPSAAVWAMMRLLGRSGYASLARSVISKRVAMQERLRLIDSLEFVVAPRMTSVGFRVKADESRTRKLYDELSSQGYRITPHLRPSFFIRIIAHHHTQLSDIERLCEAIACAMR